MENKIASVTLFKPFYLLYLFFLCFQCIKTVRSAFSDPDTEVSWVDFIVWSSVLWCRCIFPMISVCNLFRMNWLIISIPFCFIFQIFTVAHSLTQVGDVVSLLLFSLNFFFFLFFSFFFFYFIIYLFIVYLLIQFMIILSIFSTHMMLCDWRIQEYSKPHFSAHQVANTFEMSCFKKIYP